MPRPLLPRFTPSLALCLALAAPLVLGARAAHADIAPPNACAGAEGSSCNTAGSSYNSPGICATQTCTRTLPPTTPGGPPTTSQFSCQRCVLKDGDKDDEGCSYGGGGRAPGAGLAGTAVALALAGLRLGRRRR